jgi:hypothetical protein
MPARVAASSTFPSAEIASRLTAWKSAPVVDGSCCQWTPSVVLKMPAPRSASTFEKPSPVPA